MYAQVCNLPKDIALLFSIGDILNSKNKTGKKKNQKQKNKQRSFLRHINCTEQKKLFWGSIPRTTQCITPLKSLPEWTRYYYSK